MGRYVTTAAAVALVLVLAGCTSEAPPDAPSGASSSGASSSVASSATAGAAGRSNGQDYTVTDTTGQGDSPDGRGRWRITFAQLAGGDPAVVDAVNGASHRVAMDQVETATDGASDGTAAWTFESTGRVVFRSIAVGQVLTGTLFYGAHPSAQIDTIVIDSRSTDPIQLPDLFTDAHAGLTVLADQSRARLAEDGLIVGADDPALAPQSDTFANWLPTDEGIEIHFRPYQFGSALPAVVTVPWPALVDVLAPEMAGIATA